VLIVDDQPLFVELVATLLELEGGIEVVGTAANGIDALGAAAALRPDVVLMDIDMPVLDGIEATRRIRAVDPGICVLIVSGSISGADIASAHGAGAAGYVPKDRVGTELVSAIEAACPRRTAAAA
jgi:DNA-binding NarL/FixJ family response regulator